MREDRLIYLMHGITTPLDPRVREKMLPWLEEDPRRPEGLLSDGRRIHRLIEQSREEVAAAWGGRADEYIFTSGGTEACNLAIKGAAFARREPGATILVAATEHTAVLHPARTLGKLGFTCEELPVDRFGSLDMEHLTKRLSPRVILVSVALATPEIGTLQDVEEIARLVHAHGALLHVDACLAAGYQRVDAHRLGADLVSFSGHKFGGPRGIGALYARDGVRLVPLIEGGVNEGGRRAGAEYVAGIAGLAEASRLAAEELPRRKERIDALGARLESGLTKIEGVTLNGHPARRLRAIVNVSVDGADGESILLGLARRGIAASSGSACFQEMGKPSHVLMALGAPASKARGNVMFAIGPECAEEEIDAVVERFGAVAAALRGAAVAWS